MPVKVRELDSYLGLDSPILTLTDNVYDLVIPGDALELLSPQLWFFAIPDEAGGEDQNYIELVSTNITLDQVRILAVQEAAHDLVSDAPALSLSYELWTSWPDGVTFPLPTLSAQGNVTINGNALGLTPATVLSDARMGSHCEGKTPVIELAGTMTTPTLLRVAGQIPHIEITARTGIRGGDGLTPFFEITASSEETLCYLDAKIPLITADIELTTPVLGILEGKLPFPELTCIVSYHHHATLSANIPLIRLNTAVAVGGIGTLERNIPEIRLLASAYVESMFVSGYVPLPILNSLGTGGIGGVPGTIYDPDRFSNYVLRHVR